VKERIKKYFKLLGIVRVICIKGKKGQVEKRSKQNPKQPKR